MALKIVLFPCIPRLQRRRPSGPWPILLTSRGRRVAVGQSFKDYEEGAEQRAFMQGVVKGLMDLEEGREVALAEAKKRLGLK